WDRTLWFCYPVRGKSMRESGIRERFKCVVVGVERGAEFFRNPDAGTVFEEGDFVWIVGEEEDVHRLLKE
ncbi:MAG: TrkA C-terminal domain-containing protein, partial [Odoribacter sp.]|nr:TrkA C-terminal domain-containing protein [Odoribacter sp.]